MKFGDKLVGLRKKNGLSQEELAEKLGVSRQSVSKWESNNAYPETDKIVQICNLFDCSMDDLINDQITDLNQIERKTKNNLSKSVDSFFDFITKTINMFSDMKFTSGFKCILKMCLLALLLSILGLIVIGVTGSVIGRFFNIFDHGYTIEHIIHSILGIIWFIFSIIVIIYTFKIRYLDYYVKYKEENVENEGKEGKIELKKENNVIIRDPNDKSFTFLSTLSKVVKVFIKIMLTFFMISIIPCIIGLGVVLILSLFHITVSSFFVGVFVSTLSMTIIGLIILTVFINFIFDKKSKYKMLLISFLLSLVFFGVGIGICTISFKNFEIDDSKSLVNDKKNFDISYTDNLVLASTNLGDINYVFDESMGDKIQIEVKYNNVLNRIDSYNEEYYGANVFVINRNVEDFSMKDMYDILIKDIKNNKLRHYDESIIVNVKSSKETIDKLIDNARKVYSFDIDETKNGYSMININHLINKINSCNTEIKYNAFTKEIKSDEGCSCHLNDSEGTVDVICE